MKIGVRWTTGQQQVHNRKPKSTLLSLKTTLIVSSFVIKLR